MEKCKDRTLIQNININLSSQNNLQAENQFNTMENNVPIFNGSEATLVASAAFSLAMVKLIGYLFRYYQIDQYWPRYVYQELAMMSVYKLVIPIIHLIARKDLRNFILRVVKEKFIS